MNTSLKSRLSQFWTELQHDLFPFLREDDHLTLTPVLEGLIRVLEFIALDRFIPSSQGFAGRPQKDRIALARAFVAKAVLNLPTTAALIDRLQVDRALRRICGFEAFRRIPEASRCSRAFAEFTAMALPARVHEALIRAQLGEQLIGHIARDSSAIEAREKPAPKAPAVAPAAPGGLFDGATVAGAPAVAPAAPVPVKPRGRPHKGEERPKEPTVIERQVSQSVAPSLSELPTACDVGSKKNSKGFKETWTGDKLHIDTADGDIPVTAILTSASLHDRQAAIPLMRLSGERVTDLYDLADAAYCSGVIREVSRQECPAKRGMCP